MSKHGQGLRIANSSLGIKVCNVCSKSVYRVALQQIQCSHNG